MPRGRTLPQPLPSTTEVRARRPQVAVALSATATFAWVSWITGTPPRTGHTKKGKSILWHGFSLLSGCRSTSTVLAHPLICRHRGLPEGRRRQGQPGTTYFYRCGDPSIPDAMSDVHAFQTMPAVGQRSYRERIAIVGILGSRSTPIDGGAHGAQPARPDALLGDVCYTNLYLTNGSGRSGTDCYSCSFANSTPIHKTYRPRWDYWGSVANTGMMP